MAYDKHTWISGETITATELNDMESGIENNSERLDELTETVNTNRIKFAQTNISFSDITANAVTEVSITTPDTTGYVWRPMTAYTGMGAISVTEIQQTKVVLRNHSNAVQSGTLRVIWIGSVE